MKKVLFALVAVLAFAACTPEAYDDSAIKEQINNLDDRLTKVEEDLATLELNVAAMKSLAEALKTGKYIVSYVALEDESGYTITFNDGSSIVVKHGEKGDKGETGATGNTGATGEAGKDGVTPTITVKDVDGVLYWFINGEQGPAVYEGTPVFSSVDGNLYVTYPGETEAQWIGALTGKSIFDSVVVDEENGVVIFTFVGENGQPGDSFTLPLAVKFELVINTTVGLEAGATSVEIPYEVKGANSTTVVDVLAVACEAVIEAKVIKVSNIAAGAQLLVFADNGEGKTSIKKVTFSGESYSVEEVSEVIPAEGGSVVVKGVSNVPFEVVIPAEATWLTLAETKSAFELTFVAEANTAQEVREAEVSFVRQGTEEVLMSVTIAQEAAKPFASLINAFQSHGANSYMAAFGGSAGKDRNIATDGEYLYIPETQGTPVMWKVSLADGSAVKMPVGTVVGTGVTFAMSCPRFIKNEDPEINGGNDVLVVSSMGMGGQEAYLYFYKDGMGQDPHKVALNVPGAGGRRIGDKMSVYGTMQNWSIYYKEQGSSAIVNYGGTSKVLTVDNIWAAGRNQMDPTNDGNLGGIYFYSQADGGVKGLITTHENASYGVVDASVVFDGKPVYVAQAWSGDVNFAACHGFNFFKHNDKDYIAYTSFNAKKLYVIEGASSSDGVKAALEAHKVVFEAPIAAEDNTCASGNSAADCCVYQKNGKTYVAGHIQNVGVVVYELN